MKFSKLYEAEFLRRVNRFVGEINIKGKTEKALIRNTGRLRELLYEGNSIFVRRKSTGKYSYEIVLVRFGESLVCINSHIAPKLLIEAISEGIMDCGIIRSFKFEPVLGKSRFDILIETEIGKLLIETKSVNLVKDKVGLFPDAPTERGRKHLEELLQVNEKFIPEVVFIIQREDAECFAPNENIDPLFAEALRNFKEGGGKVRAFKCEVTLDYIKVKEEVPLCF